MQFILFDGGQFEIGHVAFNEVHQDMFTVAVLLAEIFDVSGAPGIPAHMPPTDAPTTPAPQQPPVPDAHATAQDAPQQQNQETSPLDGAISEIDMGVVGMWMVPSDLGGHDGFGGWFVGGEILEFHSDGTGSEFLGMSERPFTWHVQELQQNGDIANVLVMIYNDFNLHVFYDFPFGGLSIWDETPDSIIHLSWVQ